MVPLLPYSILCAKRLPRGTPPIPFSISHSGQRGRRLRCVGAPLGVFKGCHSMCAETLTPRTPSWGCGDAGAILRPARSSLGGWPIQTVCIVCVCCVCVKIPISCGLCVCVVCVCDRAVIDGLGLMIFFFFWDPQSSPSSDTSWPFLVQCSVLISELQCVLLSMIFCPF